MARKRAAPRKAPAPNLDHILESLRPLAVPIAELVNDPGNVRAHGEDDLTALAASLRRFGQRSTITAQKSNGMVLKGNGTLLAARELGWTHLAVAWVEDDPQTAAAYAIADNRTAELSQWNVPALTEQLNALTAEQWELPDMGFTEEALAALVAAVPEDDIDVGAHRRAAPAGLDPDGPVPDEDRYQNQYGVIVHCESEAEQQAIFERLQAEGLKVRVVVT